MTNNGKYDKHTCQYQSIKLDEINELKLLKRIDKKFIMPVENIDARS